MMVVFRSSSSILFFAVLSLLSQNSFYINMWESRLEFLSKTLVWGYRHKSLCLALDNFLDPSWAFLCIAAEKLRNMNKTKKKGS